MISFVQDEIDFPGRNFCFVVVVAGDKWFLSYSTKSTSRSPRNRPSPKGADAEKSSEKREEIGRDSASTRANPSPRRPELEIGPDKVVPSYQKEMLMRK